MKNSKSMIILLGSLALLTLIVVVGLFFFYPKETAKPVAAAPAPTAAPATTPVPDQFDPVEWTRNPSTPALQTPAATPGDQSFTVTLPPAEPAPSASGLPPSPGATFPSDTAPAAKSPAPVPVSTPVAPAAPAAAPAKVAVTPKAAPKAAPVAVKPKVKVTEYWIQVGSFKDRFQAENTSKALETQGLKGTLTTATVNGQSVVRVRVGPYTAEPEAKKYLATLTSVKEFSSSYVTKVSASRSAP